MLGFNVLGIITGLVFIFLLYSLLATTIQEIIASFIGLRARMLHKAIRRMLEDEPHTLGHALHDRWRRFISHLKILILFLFPRWGKKKCFTIRKTLVDRFYEQPLIKYTAKNRVFNKPSYIKPENFSSTVIALLKEKGNGIRLDVKVADVLFTDKETELEPETRAQLQSFWEEAEGDITKFRAIIEQWYNNIMERTTGWYKRQAQSLTLIIGLLLAVIFNVDTIEIVHKLSNDKVSTEKLTEMAATFMQTHQVDRVSHDTLPADTLINRFQTLMNQDAKNTTMLLGLGWKNPPRIFPLTLHRIAKAYVKITHHPRRILGWFITAIAISFGAPFWFDLLGKFINIRVAGAKPSSSSPANE